jgi:gluconate 2-dehydrogenase gamma chain
MPIRRRQFLATAAVGGLASCTRPASRWRFFTDAEGELVDAITAQIIPTDADPGAREAQVVNYIDLQLTRFFRRHQKLYRDGLQAINALAAPKQFVDLAPEEQIALLQKIEKGDGPSRRLFDMLVQHTMQGFYGDPRHGGNRDRVSWKMLGIPYPPLRGRAQYDFTKG